MNNIEISCYYIEKDDWLDKAERFCLTVLNRLEKKNWEISLVFTNDQYIRKLNKEFRGIDSATDELSFNQNEGENNFGADELNYAGDIVISLETLKKNSLVFDVPEDQELQRLLIHGILHLAGWDHETNNTDEKMIELQENISKDKGEKIL